jgi:hypothetical protein
MSHETVAENDTVFRRATAPAMPCNLAFIGAAVLTFCAPGLIRPGGTGVRTAARRDRHNGATMEVSHRGFVLFSAIVALAALAGAQSRPRPVYEVPRTDQAIRVDGKLDDAAWSKARPVGPFLNSVDGSPSPIKTEAKILYDDKFIYFAFRNTDENIWATMTKRDAHLWEEEVVEVFVQADPKQTSYIELEVNPLGAMIDIFLLDIRKPLHYESWNSEKLQWAVQVDGTVDGKPGDKEWTCEIALPLEDVIPAPNTPPKPGDRWRVALYRIEQLPMRAGLAWSPTLKPDFHVPSRFGEVVFTDRRVP